MIRTLFVVVIVFGYAFLVGSACILVALFQRRPEVLYNAGRLIIRLGMKLAGIQIEVKGREHIKSGQNYIFLANHQSYCDPPALVLAIPLDVRLILKKELRKLPIIGFILQLGGFVFVDREDRKQAIEAMKQAVRQLINKESFLIYPEGTRTRTGKMGPFKKGPFTLAIESEVPVLPISVSGSYSVMPPHQFRITPGRITICFHPPISTMGMSLGDRESLTDRVWKIIASGLTESEFDAQDTNAKNVPERMKD
jgi:1-acyl-sn-glycerol-3-phosphate acyltransferase